MRGYSEPPPEINPQPNKRVITLKREYELITPLYGGGAATEAPDAVTTVRGTEVRGNLRFWWRACYGGYQKPEEMKRFEDELWGKAYKKGDKASPFDETVQIVVEPIASEQVRPRVPYKIVKDKRGRNQAKPDESIPDYAAFPLQPEREELDQPNPPPVMPVYEHVRFSLTISFPREKQREIEGTLWAWETFGGIGARTRRGFGALRLLKVDEEEYTDLPFAHEVVPWIKKKFQMFEIYGNAPGNTPYLTSTMQIRVIGPYRDAMEAWRKLISKLSDFRQFPHGRAGRSKWPEAEAIRSLTGKRDSRYTPLPHPRKFPRAAFGLPIIFHFKDTGRDPENATLQGSKEGFDRLASPLILRPLLCKGGKAIGLAALLGNAAPPAEELLLKVKGEKDYRVSAILVGNEAQKIEPLMGEQNALQAFMKYLGGN